MMESLTSALSSPLADRWSLVLLHFLWQGLLAGCVYAVVRVLSTSAQVRYHFGVGCLAIMAICPMGTLFWLTAENPGRVREVRDGDANLWQTVSLADLAISVGHADPPPAGFAVAPLESETVAEGSNLPTVRTRLPVAPGPPQPNGLSWFAAPPDAWRPWLVGAWLLGVALFGVRFVFGSLALCGLRSGHIPLESALQRRVDQLVRRLRISQRVIVAGSRQVASAVASGLLRPMVLLPLAWLSELSPDMLESVIAHELAHVRRRDLWIDRFQRGLEIFLFYHPLVWWVSENVRHEREKCCDAEAAHAVHSRVAYARTLEFLATGRLLAAVPHGHLAGIGANKMRMLERIRYVLGMQPHRRTSTLWPLGLMLTSLLVWGLVTVPTVPLNAALESDEIAALGLEAGGSDASELALAELHAPGGAGEDPQHSPRESYQDREGEDGFNASDASDASDDDEDEDEDEDEIGEDEGGNQGDLRKRLRRMERVMQAQTRRMDQLTRQNQQVRKELEATRRRLREAQELLREREFGLQDLLERVPRERDRWEAEQRERERATEEEEQVRAAQQTRLSYDPLMRQWEEESLMMKKKALAAAEARKRELKRALQGLEDQFAQTTRRALEQREREEDQLNRRREHLAQRIDMEVALQEIRAQRNQLERRTRRRGLETEYEKLKALREREGQDPVELGAALQRVEAELELLAAEEKLTQREMELQAKAERLDMEAELREAADLLAVQVDQQVEQARRTFEAERQELIKQLERLEQFLAHLNQHLHTSHAHDRGANEPHADGDRDAAR